jgi:hypothetical protein
LEPVKVFDESINVLSGEVEPDPLNEKERNGPEEMKEEFFTFLCFCNYLVFFDKVKHGKKRPTMDPDTEQLDNKASFLVTNDTFGKEYPETPVANDDNRLEGKGYEMKPGE